MTKNVLSHQLLYIFYNIILETFFLPCNNDNQQHFIEVTLIGLITYKSYKDKTRK